MQIFVAMLFCNSMGEPLYMSVFIAVGIPTLVILKRATGELITANGRGSVSSDPNGEVSSNCTQ